MFLSNRAGLEEAFIVAAERDDGVTEEMIEAMRVASERAAVASERVDVSEGLFMEDDEDLEDDDYVYDDEDLEDDDT